MATKKKTAEVDYSMYEKIVALYELQKIDSQIDEINKVKGELPLEVEDLEDTVAGLNTRLDNINREIEELASLTKQRQREIEEANALIARYKEQQDNVRNNREYVQLSAPTEIELKMSISSSSAISLILRFSLSSSSKIIVLMMILFSCS